MHKPRTFALAATAMILALAAAAPAQAACGPAGADFSIVPPLPAVPVSVDLRDDRVLLGKHGERVPADRRLITVDDNDDLNPRTWADRVDWLAYPVRDGADKQAPAKLYFDPDGRLCRMERYLSVRGKARLEGGYVLEYDAAGALAGYVEYALESGNSAPPPFHATRHACLRRDASGALTAFIEEGCDDPKGPGAGRHYVRDASGRLSRIIDISPQGMAVAVRTFDAEGKPAQRYVLQLAGYFHPNGLRPYAFTELPDTGDRLFPLHREELAGLQGEAPEIPWRVVRIKDDVPMEDEMSWDPDKQTILAQGELNAQGAAVLTPALQRQVWQAMRDHPGRIFFYPAPMTRYLLVAAMPPAQWQACGDPLNQSPDACAR